MTDAASWVSAQELRTEVARAARAVPLRLGPNATAMAQRGEPVILNMGEADAVADAVMAVLPPGVRAAAILEAADFLRDAHFRDGLSVQEIGTAMRNWAAREREVRSGSDRLAEDTCRPAGIGGETVRVHGAEEMNEESRTALAEVIGVVRRHMDAEGQQGEARAVHACAEFDTWFDRTVCADPCGGMHQRCTNCGVALDGCTWFAAPTSRAEEASAEGRPRCPFCQMPHDLAPDSVGARVCVSIRDRIAASERRHAGGDHGGCAAVDCETVRTRLDEERPRDALMAAHAALAEQAGRDQAALGRVRGKATEWAALAPPDDWGNTPQDTVLADAGRYLLELIDTAGTYRPRRGDEFEAWLKARRDRYDRTDRREESSEFWHEFDAALDLYRLHADTGTPLDRHACPDGRCECASAGPGEDSS